MTNYIFLTKKEFENQLSILQRQGKSPDSIIEVESKTNANYDSEITANVKKFTNNSDVFVTLPDSLMREAYQEINKGHHLKNGINKLRNALSTIMDSAGKVCSSPIVGTGLAIISTEGKNLVGLIYPSDNGQVGNNTNQEFRPDKSGINLGFVLISASLLHAFGSKIAPKVVSYIQPNTNSFNVSAHFNNEITLFKDSENENLVKLSNELNKVIQQNSSRINSDNITNVRLDMESDTNSIPMENISSKTSNNVSVENHNSPKTLRKGFYF